MPGSRVYKYCCSSIMFDNRSHGKYSCALGSRRLSPTSASSLPLALSASVSTSSKSTRAPVPPPSSPPETATARQRKGLPDGNERAKQQG